MSGPEAEFQNDAVIPTFELAGWWVVVNASINWHSGTPGIPDLVMFHEDHTGPVWVEVKRPDKSTSLSDNQKQWHKKAREMGETVLVIDSWEALQDAHDKLGTGVEIDDLHVS